jgi:proteasome-associated ATPase
MSRNATMDVRTALLLEHLKAVGEEAPSSDEKQRMLADIRSRLTDASQIDRYFIDCLENMALGLKEAKASQKKLRELIGKMTSPPYHPAILLGLENTGFGFAAMVLHGNMRRIVSMGNEIDPGTLTVGDEVLLSSELNMLMAKSPYPRFSSGQTAQFERYTQDGRLILKSRDEEIVVHPAGELCDVELRIGDEVRYDKTAWIAYERLERSSGEHFFLEETPHESFLDIGGLERQVKELQSSILLHFYHPDMVSKYRLKRKKAVLLFGPAGTGKTLMARALANWLAELSNSGRSRFINVKPASLHSMWYGQSQANYREVFRVAREAGVREPEVPVVIFFDEVDSIGAIRGKSIHRIDDQVLDAFMAELNGLEDRGNILVVSATNRLEALDPALSRWGRLGDLILRVPRPGRTAARDIFRKHLHSDIPYASNGHDTAAGRDLLIDSAVSQIYSPNGDSELATITFRDGKQRTIQARHLISGAEIAKISQIATERACLRETEIGSCGISLEDILAGVTDFFKSATQGLTPGNCRNHLDDLPQDTDVVRVDPIERKVRQPYNYLNFVR